MSGESNVVAMPGYSVPTPYGEPVDSVVEIMREYLARAEAGEIRAVAIATVASDGGKDESIFTDFAAAAGHSWALFAALGRLSRRFNAWLDE